MKKTYYLSDLITLLQEVKAQHGDLMVTSRYCSTNAVYPFEPEQFCVRYLMPRLPKERINRYTPLANHEFAEQNGWQKVYEV